MHDRASADALLDWVSQAGCPIPQWRRLDRVSRTTHRVVFGGRPNAGKSTLLKAMLLEAAWCEDHKNTQLFQAIDGLAIDALPTTSCPIHFRSVENHPPFCMLHTKDRHFKHSVHVLRYLKKEGDPLPPRTDEKDEDRLPTGLAAESFEAVEVYLPIRALGEIELIDTAGLGELDDLKTPARWQNAVAVADLVCFLLGSESTNPVDEQTITLLARSGCELWPFRTKADLDRYGYEGSTTNADKILETLNEVAGDRLRGSAATGIIQRFQPLRAEWALFGFDLGTSSPQRLLTLDDLCTIESLRDKPDALRGENPPKGQFRAELQLRFPLVRFLLERIKVTDNQIYPNEIGNRLTINIERVHQLLREESGVPELWRCLREHFRPKSLTERRVTAWQDTLTITATELRRYSNSLELSFPSRLRAWGALVSEANASAGEPWGTALNSPQTTSRETGSGSQELLRHRLAIEFTEQAYRLYLEGNYRVSEALAEEALRLDDTIPRTYAVLGCALTDPFDSKRLQRATDAFDRAGASALSKAGRALLLVADVKQENYSARVANDAAKLAKEALAWDKLEPVAHLAQAAVQATLHSDHTPIRTWRTASQLEPNCIAANHGRMRRHQLIGNRNIRGDVASDLAVPLGSILERLTRADHTEARHWLMLADTYDVLGDRASQQVAVNRLNEHAKEHPLTLYRQGILALRLENFEEAMRGFTAAINASSTKEHSSEWAEPFRGLGEALLLQKKDGVAEAAFKQAETLCPGSSPDEWVGCTQVFERREKAAPSGNEQDSRRRSTSCSFCRRRARDVGPLVEGPGEVYICRECNELCTEILEAEHERKRKRDRPFTKVPTPREIVADFDRFVVGQHHAKRVLAVAVHNHYKRLNHNASGNEHVEIEKSNVLMLGPTGTGKTLLVRTLARLLEVPVAIGDATSLTEAGYFGDDVEQLLWKLLSETEFDIETAQRGIVYIDEIDKIATRSQSQSPTRDVSGEGVQQGLLKLMEGTVANVPPQGGRKHADQQYIRVDTTNILFICGGTFSGLEDVVAQRVGTRAVGFGSAMDFHDRQYATLLAEVSPADLMTYGMIPEFVARLPVFAAMEPLGETELFRILTEPEHSLVAQYEKLFEMSGATLEFTTEALCEIARLAYQRKTGARALRAVMEELMLNSQYELPESGRGKRYPIDLAQVREHFDSRRTSP